MKTRLRSYLVFAVTFVLLYLVVRKVGINELLETWREANVGFVVATFGMMVFLVWASAVKWQILLKSQGISVSFWRLIGLYLVGRFFNNFLPSNVGGDVVRAYELGNYTNNQAEAMASVFIERLTGFITLVLLALLSFVTNIALVQEVGLALVMALAVVAIIGVLWMILDARLLQFVARRVTWPFAQKYITKFQKFHSSLYAYKDRKQALGQAFVWSFIFQAGAIVNVYFGARAFHDTVPFLDIVVIVPILMLVAMLPITFNGLGVQEWAYVLLFGWIGLPVSVGLSAVLLIRSNTMLSAIVGGLIYPRIRLHKREVLAASNGD